MNNLTEQIEKFWSILPHPTPEHVVRLFAKKGDVRYGDYARTPSELKRFMLGSSGLDVYVAPNATTSTTGIRHSASDVTHWSFIFFDIDPIEHHANPSLFLEELLKLFGGWTGRDLFKNSPTIIDSGRGIQAWLRLKDEILSETKLIHDCPEPLLDCSVCHDFVLDRKTVRKIMGYWLNHISDRMGLLHGCRLDTSVSDLPRIMRMPGTINTKTSRMASVLEYQKEPYPWLAPFLIAGVPDSVFLEPDTPIAHEGTPWQLVFHRLSLSSQRYIQEGKSEPGRHKVAWHTAKRFCELGISREQAYLAISIANKKQGEDQELDEGAIKHAIKTAYS